jgi:hypothetical protein
VADKSEPDSRMVMMSLYFMVVLKFILNRLVRWAPLLRGARGVPFEARLTNTPLLPLIPYAPPLKRGIKNSNT